MFKKMVSLELIGVAEFLMNLVRKYIYRTHYKPIYKVHIFVFIKEIVQ